MKILNKKTWKIPSKSNKGMYHEVVKVFDEWSCDCIRFMWKGDCSHIKIAKKKDEKEQNNKRASSKRQKISENE